MERKQAGKVERKTVDVYVRLGTSAWSQSDEDARPPAAIVRLGGCQRNATPAESSPHTARQRQEARRPDGDGRALRPPMLGLPNGAPDVRVRAHEP